MRCEIVKCEACGREILPGAPIIRVNQGLCGVIPPAYMGIQHTADFHPQCVQVMIVNQQAPLSGWLIELR